MRYAFQKGPMQAQTTQKVADRKIDHKMQRRNRTSFQLFNSHQCSYHLPHEKSMEAQKSALVYKRLYTSKI